MNYYEVAILKSPQETLTYQYDESVKPGTKILISLRNRKNPIEAVVVKEVDKPEFKCTDIFELLPFYYNKKMIELASFISQYYVCSFGEAIALYTPCSKEIEEIDDEIKFDSNITLSIEQQEAFKFYLEKKQFLLFANTGSGKTEIYIKAIEKVLNEKANAILLMPEISLTPQMQNRLEKVFGNSVAIWHSKVSKKRKEQVLDDIYSGDIKVVAGARSALFLPFKNLKLIVVDEEHDESYKSDSKPRYNAKDLSIYIAKKYDLNLILGSATASIGSFYKLPFFRLKRPISRQIKKYILMTHLMNSQIIL